MVSVRVAARLAMNGPAPGMGVPQRGSFHGRDVIVRALSATGFEADCDFACPEGSIVRLKLPCIGVALARVTRCTDDLLSADFVNPVALSRIANVLGVNGQRLAIAAA